MKIKVNFFHESNKPKNAERAVRFLKNRSQFGFEIIDSSLYLNKGSVVECSAEVVAQNWAEFVFNVIQFGQSIGARWSIAGDIEREFLMSTNCASLGQGITMIDISIARSNFEDSYE